MEGATLAIDLSTRGDGLALVADQSGTLLASCERLAGLAGLVGAMRSLLAAPGPPVSRVVAARGPGSYMGVRSALATAVGMAQARGLPLGLVGSLVVQANRVPVEAESLLVVVAAGRGGTYVQRFRAISEGGLPAWMPDTQAMVTRGAVSDPGLFSPSEMVFDQTGERTDGTGPGAGAVRSSAEALALLCSRGGFEVSGYDLVSADYGVRVGEQT